MLADLFADALRNVRAHWLRVLLTSSGIVWGIALFVLMIAVGDANREHYRERLEVIGRKAIWVFPGAVIRNGSGAAATRRVDLDLDDPPRLPGSPAVEHAAPEMFAVPRILKGGGHIKVVWTMGVGPHAAPIRNYQIAHGRFISQGDVDARRRVLVLGHAVKQRLFGRRTALGETVRLDGHRFRVVGVSVRKGEQLNNMGPRDDEQVLLPITTAQTLFTGDDLINYIIYEPPTREQGVWSIDRVRALLGRHHAFKPQDAEAVAFFNIADAIKLVSAILVAVVVFLSACGVLTLAVGAVGVMNIMLVAVTERTREIGLRKALGATHRDLFIELVFETTIITVAAGAVGVGLAAAIIYGLGLLYDASPGFELIMPRVSFPPGLALLSCIVLVTTGILAGVVPALRAARLDPSVAMRED